MKTETNGTVMEGTPAEIAEYNQIMNGQKTSGKRKKHKGMALSMRKKWYTEQEKRIIQVGQDEKLPLKEIRERLRNEGFLRSKHSVQGFIHRNHDSK